MINNYINNFDKYIDIYMLTQNINTVYLSIFQRYYSNHE